MVTQMLRFNLILILILTHSTVLLAETKEPSLVDKQWKELHSSGVYIKTAGETEPRHPNPDKIRIKFRSSNQSDTAKIKDFKYLDHPFNSYQVVTNDSATYVLVSNTWSSTKGVNSHRLKVFSLEGELVRTFKDIYGWDLKLSPSGEFFTKYNVFEGTTEHYFYLGNIESGKVFSYPDIHYSHLDFVDTHVILSHQNNWLLKINSKGKIIECNYEAQFHGTNCQKIRANKTQWKP